MSDLLDRARKAQFIVRDLSLPRWLRLKTGFVSFAGLEITGIAKTTWEPFESSLVQISRLLDDYKLSSYDDIQHVSDDDISEGLEILGAACDRAIESEVERLIEELDRGMNKIPTAAILEIRKHRDLMVPRLIRVLREAAAAARPGEVPEGNAHFFALFLLSEFNATEAYPAIVEVISLPGDLPFDLFGDAVTTTLSRILAQFTLDAPEGLDALIEDVGLNRYVRWESLQAFPLLVRDQRLARAEAVRRMQRHLRQAIACQDSEMVSSIVTEMMPLAPWEALDDVNEAYDRNLVDVGWVSRKDVETSFAAGDAGVQESLARCPPTGIADTIDELRRWASFADAPAKPAVKPPVRPVATTNDLSPLVSLASRLDDELFSSPAPRPSRVGRNDPCPCGSGRKFKKCCWSRI